MRLWIFIVDISQRLYTTHSLCVSVCVFMELSMCVVGFPMSRSTYENTKVDMNISCQTNEGDETTKK